MEYAVLILLIIAGLCLYSLLSGRSSRQKLQARLEASFGQAPTRWEDPTDSIDSYHDVRRLKEPHINWVDALTWDDLDLDQVFGRINQCCTSVGEEYLYHLLHIPCFDAGELSKREPLISYLKANPDQRLKLQIILSGLGKRDHNGLSSFMGSRELKPLPSPYVYRLLSLLPLVGILLIPWSQSAGIGLLIASFAVNLLVYYGCKREIELDLATLEYFAALLFCCQKIGKLADDPLKPLTADLVQSSNLFRSLSDKIPILSPRSVSDLDVIMEYLKVLFLFDLTHYNQVIKRLSQNIAGLQKLYTSVGELDASISILSFRESLPYYCTPQFREENTIDFQGIYHPLLPNSIANDAAIHRSCIITGSNASGKSTFIKAVAVNGVLAQTINTCTAHHYAARCSLVMTSMAVRDHLLEGDSYFITEIKSLKRILDQVRQTPCLCLIDEILKGTNTVERIAASAAVLHYLHGTSCLCLVASHDHELTELLRDEYDSYHFSEQITDEGIRFDYRLQPGATQTRNAIKLLHVMGFDDHLVAQAELLVDQFLAVHHW